MRTLSAGPCALGRGASLEPVVVLKRKARADRHARQWRVDDGGTHPGLRLDEARQATQHRAAAGEQDALAVSIRYIEPGAPWQKELVS